MEIKLKSDIDLDINNDEIEIPEIDKKSLGVDQRKKLKEFSIVSIFYWFGLVAAIVMAILAIAPVASFMAYSAIGLLWIFVVLVPTVITFGIVWLSDGYKELVGFINGILSSASENDFISKVLDFVSKAYWYVLGIGGGILLIGLVLSIIKFKQDSIFKRIRKRKMIGLIIFASMFVVTAIVAAAFIVIAE
ncbi:MAG: hypothetical protein K6E21_05195 [Bacilli bacterium]|nr:hypothetical protein [Bacilli bacterium]